MLTFYVHIFQEKTIGNCLYKTSKTHFTIVIIMRPQ